MKRRCPRCRRWLRKRQRSCSQACKQAQYRNRRVVAPAVTAAAPALRPGPARLAAQLAEERGQDLGQLRELAEQLGLQLLAGQKPEPPPPPGTPAGSTAEYGQLLAIHRAEGPVRKRLVDRFVQAQAGLARAYAARWAGGEVERVDLEQVALLGLLEAVVHWTPERARGGWQKYAFLWMRAKTSELVHRQGLVREPVQVRLDRKKLERELRAAPDLTDQQLAARTGLSVKRVRQAREAAPKAVFDSEV